MSQNGVQDTVTRMLHALDALDWPSVEAAFADELQIDYSSLFGGEPETLTAAELMTRWRALLPGFDATQHMTGPIVVSVAPGGSAATAQTHVRGYHYIAEAEVGPIWQIAGHYVIELVKQPDGWKITGLTLQTFFQDGNRSLPDVAAERARATPRSPLASSPRR